jgi:hypothetical protein
MRNIMENFTWKWKEIKSNSRTFQLEDEPELIHIIKTGFNNTYMVVFEDAYELELGNVIFGTKLEIEKRFNINL